MLTECLSASDKAFHLNQHGHPMSIINGPSTIEKRSTEHFLDMAVKRQIDSKGNGEFATLSANGLTEFEMS